MCPSLGGKEGGGGGGEYLERVAGDVIYPLLWTTKVWEQD